MTQGAAEVKVTVALLLPVVLTTWSSPIFSSGLVMMGEVNPLPAAPVRVKTLPAPKINSLAAVVVAVPLLAVALPPHACALQICRDKHNPR